MKRILLSLLTISIVIGASYASVTSALFTDEETITGNTFSAGILDLVVGGEEASTKYTAENVVPGESHTSCTTVRNAGTVPGVLSVAVDNPVSNENGTLEQERADGDIPGQEVDNTGGGFDQNEGAGELWDQTQLTFFIDKNGDGMKSSGLIDPFTRHNTTGDTVDLSSTAHINLGEDLFPFQLNPNNQDYWEILEPESEASVCLVYTFLDEGDGFRGTFGGLTNNMAMSDDVVFDVIFGLTQATE